MRYKNILKLILLITIISPIKSVQAEEIVINELYKSETQVALKIKNKENKLVKLPNGNWSKESIILYTVNRNGTYDFVIKTDDNLKNYEHNITGLRENLLITKSPNVHIKLQSEDLLSGVDKVSLKNESNGTWSEFIDYNNSVPWTLDKNSEGVKSVYAKFRDLAGNESIEVLDKIILDMSAPQKNNFTINSGDKYTKSKNVNLYISATDTYSEISKVYISNDNINWIEKDYVNNIPWKLSDGTGNKTVYMKLEDSVGNISTAFTTSIIYDNISPNGIITIKNENNIVNSNEVDVTINFNDEGGSGIYNSIKVLSKDGSAEKILTNVSSPHNFKFTLPISSTGQLVMVLLDNAGNETQIESNIVKIDTFDISQFKINSISKVDNFNQVIYPFAPQELKRNSEIEFDINYNEAKNGVNRENIRGKYIVEIKHENGYKKILNIDYKDTIENGFRSKFSIPDNAPIGAIVTFKTSILADIINGDSKVTLTAILPKEGDSILIGKIGLNLNDDVLFNQIS